MKVILISAKSQHGKDTVAKLIQKDLQNKGKSVLIIHFADPVKWLARDFFNWDGNKDINGRELLQTLGTEIMRKNFPTYWAEIISKFIAAANKWDYVLIPDWRFENEFEIIYKYNPLVTTIRVNRFNKDGSKFFNSNMTCVQRLHISEWELDNFPFEWIIDNRGTIEDLKNSVEIMLEHI